MTGGWSVRRRPWVSRTFVGVGLGLAVVWAYWPTLADMARRWREPQYSHGYLVPVFAALLLWVRLPLLGTNPREVNWWGAPLVVLGAALHLAGAYFYFDWLDGFSLVPLLAGLCVLLGGFGVLQWAWPAVAFLVFMLPLPFRLEVGLAQPLQSLATGASTYLLQTLGVPALAEGNVIVMDNVRIGVVEACSGLSMLVTFVALSSAVALILQRPLFDKVVVLASAVPLALAVNVVRITTTGVLHETAGSRVANLFFHDLAGWLMMPLALGLLWVEVKLLDRVVIQKPVVNEVPPVIGLPHPVRSRKTAETVAPSAGTPLARLS